MKHGLISIFYDFVLHLINLNVYVVLKSLTYRSRLIEMKWGFVWFHQISFGQVIVECYSNLCIIQLSVQNNRYF